MLFVCNLGDINSRTASICILILMAFPKTAPVSEKTLSLFMHIYTQCMPSEHMHHSYSISSVANASFAVLAEQDGELYAHLQVTHTLLQQRGMTFYYYYYCCYYYYFYCHYYYYVA
jgi:hypothetical protein